MNHLFQELREINERPACFEYYTADELWTNEHIAKQMLGFHLNQVIDLSSRNGAFIKRSVEWISSLFNLDEETTVADFGCGPGLYTTALAERGAAVTGIDFSRNSLDYAIQTARKKALGINYVHCNYLDFSTADRFDLITMIMCDFCALSPEQRAVMLKKFHSLLKEGGSVLLDVYSMKSFEEKSESTSYELNHLNRFWSPDDYYCFVNTFKYEKEKVMLDKYTIIENPGKRIVYNWLQYFSDASLRAEFEENGFVIEGFYSDVAGKPFSSDSPEIAVVARKR